MLADQERLGLAMDALLENAIRHTADGDLIQLSVTGADGLVLIAVSDTGSDIEAGELAHVYDRFRTGTNGSRGTGLGLALVRAAADAHGGSARVRSVPGEGSEFEIRLPAPLQT